VIPESIETEDLLREALRREGAKRGEDFWDKVAHYAFTDRNVLIAVLKKFVPDMTKSEIEGAISVTEMPQIEAEGTKIAFNIGEPVISTGANPDAGS